MLAIGNNWVIPELIAIGWWWLMKWFTHIPSNKMQLRVQPKLHQGIDLTHELTKIYCKVSIWKRCGLVRRW